MGRILFRRSTKTPCFAKAGAHLRSIDYRIHGQSSEPPRPNLHLALRSIEDDRNRDLKSRLLLKIQAFPTISEKNDFVSTDLEFIELRIFELWLINR